MVDPKTLREISGRFLQVVAPETLSAMGAIPFEPTPHTPAVYLVGKLRRKMAIHLFRAVWSLAWQYTSSVPLPSLLDRANMLTHPGSTEITTLSIGIRTTSFAKPSSPRVSVLARILSIPCCMLQSTSKPDISTRVRTV